MIPKIIPWDERSKLPASSGKGEINTDLICHLDWLKKELAKCKKANYKGIFMEDELVLLIMDSGGEHLTPEDEARVGSIYKKYCEASTQKQTNATQALKDKRNARARTIWTKNQDLVENSSLSMEGKAQIILNQWHKRGDSEDKPNTTKTIINWFKAL
jgi:hypothetical protein